MAPAKRNTKNTTNASSSSTSRKRTNATSSSTSSTSSNRWQLSLPNNYPVTVDPLFRFRVRIKMREIFPERADSLELELFLFVNGNPILYEQRTLLLLHALKNNRNTLLKKYNNDERTLVALDEYLLLPESKHFVENIQKQRDLRRMTKSMLLEKLTKDLDSNDTPTLRCRKCGGQADFNPVQTRSADEPMTIFGQCLNPKCNSKWKM